MSEWWTYRLSDFLLFSPPTYYRLVELYNLALWPAQVLSLALGIAVLLLLLRGGAGRGRLVAAILAMGWLWIAWAFLFQRYRTINWAAVYFAAGFAMEAVLLVWAGVIQGRFLLPPARNGIEWAGFGIFLFALVGYPCIALLMGRQWAQAEVFGVAPDPTAVATLGIMLLATPRPAWPLMAIPTLWCAASGATLWAMKSPDALGLPLLALLALGLAVGKTLLPQGPYSRPRR